MAPIAPKGSMDGTHVSQRTAEVLSRGMSLAAPPSIAGSSVGQTSFASGSQVGLPAPGSVMSIASMPPPTPGSGQLSMRCWFECGTSLPMSNIATDRHPKYACRPCTNAKRALDLLARKDKAIKAELEDLKRNRAAEYKLKVISSRLRDPAEPPTCPGVGSLEARTSMLGSYHEEFKQHVAVKVEGAVKWCDEGEFMAHFKYQKNWTEADAKAKWDADIANPDIQKVGSIANPRIAVRDIPRTVGEFQISQARGITGASSIRGAADLRAANQRMSSLNPDVTAPLFARVGGAVLGSGAASGEASGSSLGAIISEESMQGSNLKIDIPGGTDGRDDALFGSQEEAKTKPKRTAFCMRAHAFERCTVVVVIQLGKLLLLVSFLVFLCFVLYFGSSGGFCR